MNETGFCKTLNEVVDEEYDTLPGRRQRQALGTLTWGNVED